MADIALKQKLAFSLSFVLALQLINFVPLPAADQPQPGDLAGQASPLEEGSPQTLKGGITSLKVTSGRSQIVKFAQPVVRLSIADPEKADIIPLAPDQIMINGKSAGVTSLVVWDEEGQEGIFDLFIENDTSAVMRAINAIAPKEKIEVRITEEDKMIISGQVSNSIVLDEIRRTASAFGYVDDADPSKDKFVDVTEAPVPQVILEVKVAEASRSVARDLKTNIINTNRDWSLSHLGNSYDATVLSALDSTGRSTVGLPGIAASQSRVAPPLNPFRALSVNNTGGLVGTLFDQNKNFKLAWDLLETKGKVTTLAEPSLVCTHGRQANFLAGGEFPFVKGIDTAGNPIIEYKEYGVKLNFTPWIAIRSGRIELTVSPEVSNLDTTSCQTASGLQVCGLLRRSTSTTVELKDGESLLISGILTREENNSFAQAPFIANLPIIGNFFKNFDTSKSERELVIVVTPRIVKKGDYGSILGTQL